MSRPVPLDYELPARPPIAMPATRSTSLTTVLRGVATVGVAVWLGSLVHLLLVVSSLFAAFPKAVSGVAVEAAPVVFRATERFGLLVAAITLAGAVGWHWATPARARRWLVWLLATAAALAVAQTTIVSVKMDALRAAGRSGDATFRTLHGVSSTQYLAQTAIVLAATLILPAAIRAGGRGTGQADLPG